MGQFDRTLEYIDQLQHAATAAAVCERLLGITSDFGGSEISLFQQALQDDTTLRRLQRIARLAA